jgi:hypothetical protein
LQVELSRSLLRGLYLYLLKSSIVQTGFSEVILQNYYGAFGSLPEGTPLSQPDLSWLARKKEDGQWEITIMIDNFKNH